MTTVRALVGLVCLTFACSSSTNNRPGNDLAVDMAAPQDLLTAQLSCSGVIQCLAAAGQSGGTSCLSRATSKASMLLNALITCGKTACLMSDASTPSCTSVMDNSPACMQCATQDLQTGDCAGELQACLADK